MSFKTQRYNGGKNLHDLKSIQAFFKQDVKYSKKRLINLTAFKVRTFMYKKTHEESEEAKYKLGE